MLKRMSKRIAAFLLMITVLLSSNVYLVSAAGFKGALATFGTNKLLDFGYRTTAKIINVSLNAIGDATGSEEVNKAASLINTILMGGTGKSLKNIQSLCGEILSEIKDLKVDIYDCFSVVEQMLGEDRVKEAKKEVDDKWKEYITDVIDKNNATLACNYLDDYIDSALKYSEDPNNDACKVAYEDNLELMMHGFANMCKEEVPSSAYNDKNMYGAKKIIFGGTSVDDSLMNLVDQFSSNLTKNSNQSITLAECAADMAYEYFPFSHQQYQYVNTVIGDQLTELSMCMLLASEYFDMKGEFILEEYGEDSDEYAGYMNTLKIYQNTILQNVNSRINEMLEAEMTVGVSTKIKLNDYMRPEDAKDSVTLQINDYLDSYKLKVSEGSGEYYEYYTITSNPVYINNKYLKFKRVMTHANGDNTVYYIIDPSQFSNSDTLKCLSLDYKYDVKFGPDTHITSCDFQNLIKKMTDGANTFAVPNNSDKLLNLFGTNAFSLSSRYPDNYLADYLTSKNDDTVFYFLTSSYRNIAHSSSVSTSYGELYLIYGSEAISGTEMKNEYVSLEKFQSDKGGDIYKYSAILTNQNDTYQQTAHLQTKENGVSSAKLVNEDGSITVNNGESKKINSGDKVTVKFKLQDGAEFKSLKCVRNSDSINNKGTTTETVLLEKDDINLHTPDGDGYYSFEYPMPYSDATFVVEAIKHNFDDNGFCTECGAYQPATLNGNGVYEIGNAGQLFWFASLVNGDDTHADFDAQNTGANAVLVKDINLESREWSPIRDYTGNFDGQNHTISDLKITETPHDTGLFRSVYGTIKNFTVKGEMIISTDGDYIGGVVGYADGSTISNVASYVNISNTAGVLHHIGGVVGYIANKDTFVDKCLYYGTVDIKNSTDCIGGIVGYTNAGARISNCANHGTVTTSEAGAYTGGILGYLNNSNPTIKDCYNYGKVSNGDSTQYCGAIIGWVRNHTASNIDNNYYLDSSSALAFGSGGKSEATVTEKTSDEFKSGEVAYLLNHKITDGSQVWYQNIDNGETPDDYPVFDGGTVYYLEYMDGYSNTYSEKPEPDEFDKDENGNFIIRTYDDLVKLSNLVRSDYENYGSADYILENNIKAPADSEWTQGIGSVSNSKHFNGTFNGNGYCIIGLNVNSPKYGGLFEVIGISGVVKDLFVFDCDFSSSSEAAGGIAAVNKGKIDHCTSGVNITSGYIHKNGKDIYAPELNSSISGERSGGIAGENSGSTIGCRSSAVVSGTTCGGITGVNTGKIYGCANNGKVGTSTSSVSGGLAGKNGDTIESSYNSGNVNGDIKGLIAGKNGFGDTTPTVTDVFYISQGGLTAFGTTPWDTSYDTIIEKTSDVKKDDSFANELNSVTDTSIVKWKQDSNLHKGYPTIEGNFYIDVVKSAGNNITVQGSMHKDLNIKYDVCSENSEEYKLLSSAKGNNKILNTYSVSLTDNDGNYIPAELWCSGSYKISVPVDSKNIQLAGIDTEDGNIVYYKPDSVENGTAVFTVSYPMSFAIVETTAENPSSVNNNNGTPIQTGSVTFGILLLVALLSLTVILIVKRRNKIG
ncbi:MAG: hypothetical protein ACI4G0_04200 [Ruminococcus sp.]